MATIIRTWEEVEAERAEQAARVAKTVFVYCRSSFVDKKKVDRQDRQGVQWAENRWPDADVIVFRDDGESGGSDDRPAWNEMKARIAAGEPDAVVTWTVSRLTRNVTIGEQFAELCRDTAGLKDIWMAGADKPVSIREADMGEWRQHIVMATQQREDAKVSVRNAHERNAIDGVPNNLAPLGYRNGRDPDDERALWEVDEAGATTIRMMFDLVEQGMSVAAITRHFNDTGRPTSRGGRWRDSRVHSYLRNPAYIGRQVYAGVLYPKSSRWEPLVSEEQWNRVQRILDDASNKGGHDRSRKWWMSAVLVCSGCGGRMHGTRTGAGVPIFKCRDHVPCERPMSWGPCERVEEVFAQVVVDRANSPEFAAMVAEAGIAIDQRGAILDRIAEIDSRRSAMLQSQANGLVTQEMMDEVLTPLVSERNAYVAMLEAMQEAATGPSAGELAGITVDEFTDLPLKAKKQVAKIIFDKVLVVPGTRKGFNPRSGKLNETRFEISYRGTL